MNLMNINGFSFFNRNSEETRKIYESVFIRQDYKVMLNNLSPRIIDCGAHIGIATTYFKTIFPLASITAIEANPETLKFLKKNLIANQITDTEVIWGALSKKPGSVSLYVDSNSVLPWSWGDSIIKDIWSNRSLINPLKMIKVPSVHLSEIIKGKVDLIKMDIEGAECEVVEEAGRKLDSVNAIIIEAHPTAKTPLSCLQKIRRVLQKNKFKVREYPVDWTVFINAARI